MHAGFVCTRRMPHMRPPVFGSVYMAHLSPASACIAPHPATRVLRGRDGEVVQSGAERCAGPTSLEMRSQRP